MRSANEPRAPWQLRALRAVVLLAGLCGCATVAVLPGHSAVLMTSDGQFSVLGEGITAVPPFSLVDDFDLREHGASAVFNAVTADGVPVVASDSLVNYRLVEAELIAVDREIGPDYERIVIEPIVQSMVRRVLASYRWDELDTPHIREAQDRITTGAFLRLRPHHIIIESVVLRGIFPRLPGLAAAVTGTSVLEQQVLEGRAHVEIARKRADALREAARGIAAGDQAIAPTLNAAVLQEAENKAWERLFHSPSTTVQLTSQKSSPVVEVSP